MRRRALAMALACASGGAQAEDFLRDGRFDGELRLYRFDRVFDAGNAHDERAWSLAGLFTVKSGSVGGFRLAATGFSAQSLGTRADPHTRIDASLMALGSSLSGFSQAYAEYAGHGVTVRAGDQYLDTPWMGPSDSRVVPASYRALNVVVEAAPGWTLQAVRTLRWKSRTSDGFLADNVYYPSRWRGDTMYGQNGTLPATARAAGATTALGSTYVSGGLKARAWYYGFGGFGRMGYADATYTFATDGSITPSVGAQVLRQTGGANNVLVENATRVNGVAGNRVDARAWGLDAGAKVGQATFGLSYNRLGRQNDAVGGGAVISPYTNGYATDPLFTTSMLRGLVEQGPGRAWKARAGYGFLDGQLQVAAAYAQYDTRSRGRSHDLYMDVIWKLDRWVKGLQVRNRWERTVGGSNGLNPGNLPWTYNRLMISYRF